MCIDVWNGKECSVWTGKVGARVRQWTGGARMRVRQVYRCVGIDRRMIDMYKVYMREVNFRQVTRRREIEKKKKSVTISSFASSIRQE